MPDRVSVTSPGGDRSLTAKIADELRHNDECGPGPVSDSEYMDDAAAILRIVSEHRPPGGAGGNETEAVARALYRRSPQGEDHVALEAVARSHDNCCSPELRHKAREALRYGPCEADQGCPFCSERPNRYARVPSSVSGTEPDTAREREAYENGRRDRARAIVVMLRAGALDLYGGATVAEVANAIERRFSAGFSVDAGKAGEER